MREWIKKKGWGLLRDLAFLAIVFAAVMAWQTRKLHGAGTPAPRLSLPTLDGGAISLQEQGGKKVVVAFWAPWCGVCKAEVGNLNALAEDAGDDLQVLTVALSYEDLDSVKRFVEEQGLRAPVLLGDSSVARDWNVDVFPTLYVIDEEGRVEHTMVGYTTELGLRLRLL